MRHAKRTKLLVEDVDYALRAKNIEVSQIAPTITFDGLDHNLTRLFLIPLDSHYGDLLRPTPFLFVAQPQLPETFTLLTMKKLILPKSSTLSSHRFLGKPVILVRLIIFESEIIKILRVDPTTSYHSTLAFSRRCTTGDSSKPFSGRQVVSKDFVGG